MAKSTDTNVHCESCRGCDGCDGCRGCDGCYLSYGLIDCKATFKALFSKGLFGDKFKLFNKEISEERFDEVLSKIRSFDWYFPKQTNAFELYLQNGSEWQKIDVSKLSSKEWKDSWKDIPQGLLDYIAALPEFDETIFNEITGLTFIESESHKKAKKLR